MKSRTFVHYMFGFVVPSVLGLLLMYQLTFSDLDAVRGATAVILLMIVYAWLAVSWQIDNAVSRLMEQRES